MTHRRSSILFMLATLTLLILAACNPFAPATPQRGIHLLTTDWWTADGTVSAIAVYQPVAAASYNDSLTNIANPGTYDAVSAIAPAWDTNTGWTFNGVTQYLTTTITPDNNQQWSMLIQFSNAITNDYRSLAVIDNNPNDWWGIEYDADYLYYENGGYSSTTLRTSGNAAFAAAQGYYNGAPDGDPLSAPSGLPFSNPLPIGGRVIADGTHHATYSGTLRAIAIYSVTLTAPQVYTITTAMAALAAPTPTATPTTTPTPTATPTVCGRIATNTTWSTAQTIGCNLSVAYGVTLTLDTGASVTFTGDYYADVRGRLVANGLHSQPITITRQSTTTLGTWGPVYLVGDGSRLSHVLVTYGRGIDIAAPAYLTETTVSVNTYGLNIAANAHIRDSTIERNTYGLRIANNANPYITETNVITSTLYGLVVDQPRDVPISGVWWGVTTTASIETLILDNTDDIRRGRAQYAPAAISRNWPGKGVVFAGPGTQETYQAGYVNESWWYSYYVKNTSKPATWHSMVRASYSTVNLQWTATNMPGMTYLVFNEPRSPTQDNITPTQGATLYYAIRNTVLAIDPTARFVVGNVQTLGASDQAWLEGMATAYQTAYGVAMPLDGIGGHLYFCGGGYSSAAWRTYVTNFRAWMAAQGWGNKEFWLTEWGCLTSDGDGATVMADQLQWLNNYAGVDRHSWFATQTQPLSGTLMSDVFVLTTLGKAYK